jgi:hypothetical protein
VIEVRPWKAEVYSMGLVLRRGGLTWYDIDPYDADADDVFGICMQQAVDSLLVRKHAVDAVVPK